MEQVIRVFIALVRSEICGTALEPEVIRMITPKMLEQLYIVSRNHDMIHVVAVALKKHKLLSNDRLTQKYTQFMYMALMRYEAMKHEEEQIAKVFEQEGIVFVPLKGSVIRRYYPSAWMRTSSDIDILIHEEDLKRAKNALVKHLNYAEGRHKYHDFSLYSPNGILLELHFRIVENEEDLDKNLKKVWDYVRPVEEGGCRYEMTPEYLMFHAFAHMVYHFRYGGCGVRFVTDIWLLDKKLSYDENILQKLCKESKIGHFVKCVRKLSKVWFEEENYDSTCRRMEFYIITGGVFGSTESKITARKIQTKGNLKYFFQRVFIPYKEFCASYPRLEKMPFLYPYYTVKRWLKIFNKQIARNAVREITINRKIGQDDVDELKRLFKELKV